MTFLLSTLSWSYVKRHLGRTLLTLIGVTAGVTAFGSIKAAERSLITGFGNTVDRVAGKAQLQITGVAGVPEAVQEQLRDVPPIQALAPIIEQVVEAPSAPTGTLLLLGVDLLGDRQMRDYGFEGEDTDTDDPLLFLAQPDSVAISRDLARSAGLKKGDALLVRIAGEPRRLVVRAVMNASGFAKAFGGAIVVTDVYAAETLLKRGPRFDRLDVRLADGASIDAGMAAIRRAIGPGFDIQTPERRGGDMEQLIWNFTIGLDLSCGLALGISLFLVFTTFAIAVLRRRRDIGVLRALGATPRQVQVLFLAEAASLGALGGVLGFAAGQSLADRFLAVMAGTVEHTWGLIGSGSASLDHWLAFQCLALGTAASMLGAWAPAAAAGRLSPLQALGAGRFSLGESPQWRRVVIGVALMAGATALSVWAPKGWPMTVVIGALSCGSIGAALLVGPIARILIGWMAPVAGLASPAAARLAAVALVGHLRRNASTAAAVALALAWVLGVAGYVQSNRMALNEWTDAAMTSDLYLRTSSSLAPSTIHFPPEARERIRTLAGVRSVEGTRQQFVRFRGEQVKLVGLDPETIETRSPREFLYGDAAALRQGLLVEGQCAVSANLARRFGVSLGETIELDSPAGPIHLPVAAVLNTFISDRGAILIDRSRFVRYWQDDDVDIVSVNLDPAADLTAMRAAIAARLVGVVPALIVSRSEFVAEIDRALSEFTRLGWTAVLIASGVAFLGIVTSLFISVVERGREIGILKALGGVSSQIHWSVVCEAIGLSMTGLIIAVPLGALLAQFLSTTVSETNAGFRLPMQYPIGLLGRLLIMLPVGSAIAAWLPARQAVATRVTDVLASA